MKKIIAIALLLFTAVSCSSDDAFCECLSAGEAFNEESQKFLDKTPTPEEEAKLKELKEAKVNACADYQTMGGDEMRALKEACEAN